MIIYLAGKINKAGWRDDILGDRGGSLENPDDPTRWPILEKVIFGEHDYAGPFFVSCDHGCAHGPNTHGIAAGGINADTSGCIETLPNRISIINRCEDAITQSDLVFAWIQDLTTFGTLYEIGYARGHNVPTFVAFSDKSLYSDLWFAALGSRHRVLGTTTRKTSPKQALKQAINLHKTQK